MKTQHHIYWWNLENLFDVENDPERPVWLQKKLRSELRGWTDIVLEQKLNNLNGIICKLNNGTGPDILGVCEVESKRVLEKLMLKMNLSTGRQYKVMHQDTSDARGIDVAIIYDTAKYTDDGHQFSLEIMRRNSTRDLFQVQLTTQKQNELVLIGNHWPSRIGGAYETEPYRMMVGEILSYWVERIYDIKYEENGDKNPSIVMMGDFNDNPFNRSLTEYLRSTGNLEKVRNSTSHILYNLMYPFLGGKLGTHVYGNEINVLDQFIVTKALVVDSAKYPFQVKSTQIVHFPEMVRGDYYTPIRFCRPSESAYNPAGFSDHLPIELVLEER